MAIQHHQGENSMLYRVYQAQRDMTAPARAVADMATRYLDELPACWTDNPFMRRVYAGYEMIGRARLTHERPPFGIDQVNVAGEVVAVREETAMSTPFASLLHFAKKTDAPVPRVLVVTALAGCAAPSVPCWPTMTST
jgi:poly-beta-hydroxyalkanoate depolymerase